MHFIMAKQFLTLVLTTVILGMSPIFAIDQKIPEESIGALTISQSFNFKQGDQEALNKWVANNGAEMYRHLNNHPNFGYPEDLKKPLFYTRSQYWRTLHLYGEVEVDFIKEKGIPASTAIKSFLESEGRFDCRIAQRIVFLECMRRLMGDMAFDKCNEQFEAELSQDVFAEKGEARQLHLSGGTALNPYLRFTFHQKNSVYKSGAIGYFGYIPNVKEYAMLHPHGGLRGSHALLCSDPRENEKLYVGFGSFYKDGALHWDDVAKRFKNETLTLSLPEKPIIDGEKKPDSPRWIWYIEQMEELHASELQRHKNYIKTRQDTSQYEEEFEELQQTFSQDFASYFIDFERVDQFLNKLTHQT